MIGERLADLRKDKGMTQDELAEILFLTKFSISAYEKDKATPSDETKVLIAKYFDVSLDYLLGLIDVPASYRRGSNCVIAPKNFTPSALADVAKYIDFLAYKMKGT